MSDELHELRQAIHCLKITVAESIWREIDQKVNAVLAYFVIQRTAARSEVNSLRERVEELEKSGHRLHRCPSCGVAAGDKEELVCHDTELESEANLCANCMEGDIESGVFIVDALASPPGPKEAEGFAEAIEGDDGWVTDPEEGDR